MAAAAVEPIFPAELIFLEADISLAEDIIQEGRVTPEEGIIRVLCAVIPPGAIMEQGRLIDMLGRIRDIRPRQRRCEIQPILPAFGNSRETEPRPTIHEPIHGPTPSSLLGLAPKVIILIKDG